MSGLLRQDADGYWYYSANDNYAYFNGSSFQLCLVKLDFRF